MAVAAGGNLPLNSARGDELLVFAIDGAGAGAGAGAPRTGAATGANPGAPAGALRRATGDTAGGAGRTAVDPVSTPAGPRPAMGQPR